MRTGPTNQKLQALIAQLKQASYATDSALWKRIATDLEKPTRGRRVVNLARISRFTADGDTVIVPGKVLAGGELSKKVTIAAWQFSGDALEKINSIGAKAVTIEQFMQEDPKGKRIRVMG